MYCIPYIFHVHDSIVVCFSNISAYFARNAESLITQESLRKSCSLAGGFVPTRCHRGGRERRYLVAFVSSGVMISINSIDAHIGHESSVGVYLAKRSRIYRIESAAMVSVMFVLLTAGGAPVGLVLVFAATRSEMALRSVFV